MITIPGLRIMYVRLFQLETGVFGLRKFCSVKSLDKFEKAIRNVTI